MNTNSRVCSANFVSSNGRCLRPNFTIVELQQDEPAVQTDVTCEKLQSMQARTDHLENTVLQLEQQLSSQLFRLPNIADDSPKVLLIFILDFQTMLVYVHALIILDLL